MKSRVFTYFCQYFFPLTNDVNGRIIVPKFNNKYQFKIVDNITSIFFDS